MKCAMQLQLLKKKKKKAISFRQSKKEIKQLKNLRTISNIMLNDCSKINI